MIYMIQFTTLPGAEPKHFLLAALGKEESAKREVDVKRNDLHSSTACLCATSLICWAVSSDRGPQTDRWTNVLEQLTTITTKALFQCWKMLWQLQARRFSKRSEPTGAAVRFCSVPRSTSWLLLKVQNQTQGRIKTALRLPAVLTVTVLPALWAGVQRAYKCINACAVCQRQLTWKWGNASCSRP